jgi:hypothetical protein
MNFLNNILKKIIGKICSKYLQLFICYVMNLYFTKKLEFRRVIAKKEHMKSLSGKIMQASRITSRVFITSDIFLKNLNFLCYLTLILITSLP